MADSKQITPFIRKWEGEYGNDPDDAGGETRKGITYTTWKSVFGDTHERFMLMSDEDWNEVYTKLFWSKIQGDKIHSQIVANAVADWAWCSGVKPAILNLQQACNRLGGVGLTEDGMIGAKTLLAVNSFDGMNLFKSYCSEHREFLNAIVKSRPQNAKFLKGWNNRIDDLEKFCKANSI